MQEAYGEAAFNYIPRSYMLPSQYWVWRAWTQTTGSPPDLPWVLKANEHRGRGVRVMRQQQAQRQALRGSGAQSAGDTATQRGFVLVQSYVRQQFLYDNRPSYLRLWVVVTSVNPLRVYLFRGGVLVFGDRIRGSGGASRLATRAAAAAAGASSGASVGRRRSLQQLRNEPLDRNGEQEGGQQAGRQGKQRYEMHQVNYWTIEGEKMAPWTVQQLRRHAAASFPSDTRVFDRAWEHARESIGMVLASASRRMRSAARGLAALEGCGFEVLGVDFLLNATFHPTLVEINALPSLARLRTEPGDPGRAEAEAAGAAVADSGNRDRAGGAATAATAAGQSDAQDQTAMAAAAASVAAFDLEKERFLHHTVRLIGMPLGPPPVTAAGAVGGGGGGAAAAAATVGGVLRAAAALLRPPNNDTTELQDFLRRHLPYDMAAAADLLPSLRHLLCPVPAAWGPAPGWPTLEDAGTAIGQVTAAAAVSAAGAAAGRRLAAADGADAAEPPGGRQLRGTGAAGAGDSAGGGGGGGGAAARHGWACKRRCYDWDTLSAIADTQYELEQNLDFDPVFPMPTARDVNTAALAAVQVATSGTAAAAFTGTVAQTLGSSGGGGDDSAGSGSSRGVGGAAGGFGAAAAATAELVGTQTGIQKLQVGLGFVRESFTAVDLDLVRSMQYMTTTPYVLAKAKLPYGRLDAALSAYEAVRRRPGSCLGGGGDGAGARGAGPAEGSGGSKVAAAGCALHLLEDTLEELCGGSAGWSTGSSGGRSG